MTTHTDTVQAIYQAFGTGNIPAVLAHLTPDVQWETWADHSAHKAGHPLFQPRQGRDGAGAFFQALGGITIHEFRVLDVLAGQQQVAAEIWLDYTHNGTGQRVRDEEMHLWSFNAAGQVTRMRHYVDTAKHLRAAGLLAA